MKCFVLTYSLLAALPFGSADAAEPKLRYTLEGSGFYSTHPPAFTPDGKLLFTFARGELLFQDSATGKKSRSWPLKGASADDVLFRRDGKSIVLRNRDDVQEYDLLTGKEKRSLKLPFKDLKQINDERKIQSAAWDAEGRLVVSGRFDVGNIRIWDFESGKNRDVPCPDVVKTLLSPDGKLLVARCTSKRAEYSHRVFDVATGKVLFQGSIPPLELQDPAAFSPDGKLMACPGSTDFGTPEAKNFVRLIDPLTGKSKGDLGGYADAVHDHIAFSNDGRFLVAGDLTGFVQIWDVAKLQLVGKLKFGETVRVMMFSPDAKLLVTAGDAIQVWQTNLPEAAPKK